MPIPSQDPLKYRPERGTVAAFILATAALVVAGAGMIYALIVT